MREIVMLGPRGLRLRALVPQSRRERVRGLLDRQTLEPDEAMWFERARSVHTLGMRFVIEVVRLDAQMHVVDVRMLRPGRILLPRRGVRSVLECGARAPLHPGDRLEIQTDPSE